MPITKCLNCGNDYAWAWVEAFEKFGFDDGDGIVMTEAVAEVLRNAGYIVKVEPWGIHNVVIDSITKDGVEQIPFDRIRFGYDHPRNYLPKKLIQLLDRSLPEMKEVAA